MFTATTTVNRAKPIAIIFCRISRLPDEERGTMSLDSQEFAINSYLQQNGIRIYVVIKTVGSAYKTFEPIEQLLSVLKNIERRISIKEWFCSLY